MTRVTSETMTVTINGVDYSSYIDSISVNGGTPMTEFIGVYNGRKKRAVTGYTERTVEVNMLVDTDTDTFITELADITLNYTIIVGEPGVIENTYLNLYASEFNGSMTTSDGLELMKITFIGEGIPSNRT